MTGTDRPEDEAAIGELLMKLGSAFRDLDVGPLEDIYVEALQKRDGRWLIVSEMYMDAREEHTFEG